jgi:hypothetical protein
MHKLLAQQPVPLTTDRIGGAGLGPFGTGNFDSGNVMTKFTGAISAIIGLLTIVAAIWFFIQVLLGGISWITAGGDKAKLTEAREKISNAFIGLVVVVAGWAIVALAGQFFGWTSILSPNINSIIFK